MFWIWLHLILPSSSWRKWSVFHICPCGSAIIVLSLDVFWGGGERVLSPFPNKKQRWCSCFSSSWHGSNTFHTSRHTKFADLRWGPQQRYELSRCPSSCRVVRFSLYCVVAFRLITFSSVFLKLLFKLIYWSTCQAFLLNPLQSVLFKCGILVKNWINIMLDCSCSFSVFAPVSFIDCTWRPTYFLSSENKRQQIRLVTCRPSEWLPVTFNQNSTPFDILLSASRLIHQHWPSVVWFTWVVYTTKFTQFYLQFSFFCLVFIFQPTDGRLTRYWCFCPCSSSS